MKDNFSKQSGAYAKFRPVYPDELYQYIYSQLKNFEGAWDCGTGNGQVADVLAQRFQQVYATDISQKQLDQAVKKDNITYSVQAAETANFPINSLDLITVGQAIHWFDHQRFNEKVIHCLRSGGLLAVFGYQLFRVNEAVDAIIDHFYYRIIGPFWDPERRHIDNGYATIPFPMQAVRSPELSMKYTWNLERTLGYLSTWSSVQHYRKAKGYDPVELVKEELMKAWGTESTQEVSFPVLLRIQKKNN